MELRKQAGKLRSFVPQRARERMYEWHPGRACRWLRFAGLDRVAPSADAVLTSDDGSDPDAPPAVADALDIAGTRAPFFLLGSQLPDHLEITSEIVRLGHEIGLQGYNHHRHDRVDADLSRRDLTAGAAAVEDTLGVRCRRHRPPYGKMSLGTAELCDAVGMTPVSSSTWGLDWENVPAQRTAKQVCEQLDDGAIVLLDDSARFARRRSALPTAQAIPLIATSAQEDGIALVSLSDVVPRNMEAVA